MNKEQYFNQHRLLQIERQEMERKWRVFNEQRILMNMSLSNSASSGGGGAGGNSSELTPFILQQWGFGDGQNWLLYRLNNDKNLIPILNSPPLEGPTVFSKNTLDGLHYFVTYNANSSYANFGSWDSLTGEWQFLEEGNTLLRHLVPASLQYVEGNEIDGNYFIYTDNSQYYGVETNDIAPKTFRIDLTEPGGCQFTELHEWEIPAELGSFPISTFYQLPVAVGASPSQSLYQVQEYGINGATPLAQLSVIDGETYERAWLDLMTIDGLSIEAVKIGLILDRTDYGGITYFNIFAIDKINEISIYCIVKFDPASENPSNLTSIYQYYWNDSPYI